VRCNYCGRIMTEYDDEVCEECGLEFEVEEYIDDECNSVDDILEDNRV